MTTVITHRFADGVLILKCDAKCHNAKGPNCRCICGGINHGVGNNQAIENTRKHAAELSDAKEAGQIIINPAQYKLFQGGKP